MKIIKRNDVSKYIMIVMLVISIFAILFVIKTNEHEECQITIKMEGWGTQEYPYIIRNISDLDNLREVVRSGNSLMGKWFALDGDIDYQNEKIESISDGENAFQGGFDGRGHKIYNFSIDAGEKEGSFFGKLDGIVENLYLDGQISGKNAASIANSGIGVVINCISSCSLYAVDMTGGFVNNWDGLIQNVIFTGILNSKESAGVVNGGGGKALYVYSKNMPVGNIATLSNYGTLAELGNENVINRLNSNSRKCFLSLPYAKWLNIWIKDKESISFANDIIAFRGNGTERNPFIIDSVEKLKNIVLYLNDGYSFEGVYFYQTEDIDLSAYPWIDCMDESAAFSGVYNGNGHAIDGLNTYNTTGGLFKFLNGRIINLKLTGCNTIKGEGFAGAFSDDALIINSYCNGRLGDQLSLDRLMDNGQIINCYIDGIMEPSINELNSGLENIVINYGIHCGELNLWDNIDNKLSLNENYMDVYFEKERGYWLGSGVAADPYQIHDLKDFVYLRESVFYKEGFWRYRFIQTDNIDFSSVLYWKPISDVEAIKPFSGHYDGNGKVMANFRQGASSGVVDKSIFGNVSGTIMNVHIINYILNGKESGVLSYNLFDTGKIINNIVEISRASNQSRAAISFTSSGHILNNIFIRSNNQIPVSIIMQQSEKQSLENYEPEEANNQITDTFSEQVVRNFDNAIVDTALHIKQRITDFTLLSLDGEKAYLGNHINMEHELGYQFLLKVILGNYLLLIAVIWLFLLLLCSLVCLVNKFYNQSLKLTLKNAIQLFVILGIYFIFIIAMISYKENIAWSKIILLTTSISLLAFFKCMFYVIPVIKECIQLNKEYITKYSFCICTLLLTMFIVGLHYNTPVAYDSDLYYGSFIQAVQNFNFTLNGILNSFCIASKPMHGVAMLMVIGEAVVPGTGVGVYLINTILLLLAQASIYLILRKLFPQFSSQCDAILALCFSLSSYVLAGATYINPDFYSVVFFAMFVCSVLYQYELFALYTGFLVMCSKPNMIIPYALFIFVELCYAFFIKKDTNIKKWILYTVPLAIYLILFLGVSDLNRAGIPELSNNTVFYTLISRLLQYSVFGFIWIQELFIIVALVYLIKKKNIVVLDNRKIWFIFAIWCSCFSELLITIIGGGMLQICPRYLTLCAIKNIILFAFAFEILPIKRAMRFICITIFGVLLLIQSVVTIDPSIMLLTERKYDNLYYLVFPVMEKQDGNDLAFYNYEYIKDAKAGSKILSKLNAAEISNLYSNDMAGYKMAIGNSFVYPVYWDLQKQCRTYIRNDHSVRLWMEPIIKTTTPKLETNPNICVIIRKAYNNQEREEKLFWNKRKEEYGEFILYRNET